jgi:Na+/melibiose symporter-like transporter
VIQEYEKHHPAVTGGEIHQALDLAKQGSRKAMAANRVLVVTVAGGLAALAAVGVFMASQAGGGGAVGFPVMAVVVGILLVLGVAIALKRMGNL